jgi:membrane protease YdiL (CAAX protease family)
VKSWIVVGIAEEISFRAYLHNKLAVALKQHWLGIVLAALLFSLWHIPGSIVAGRFTVSKLMTTIVIAGFSFMFFNLTYEWTGLLPFLVLFHGWSDFPLLVTLHHPTTAGAIAGYLLVFVVLWFYTRWRKRGN